jgi:hypothetical protein
MRTYTIHEQRRAEFDARMEKLGRSATKLGLTPPTHRLVETIKRKIYRDGHPVTTWDGQPVYERWQVIEVDEPVVKLPNWHFLAVLQHTEHGNIVRVLPGAEVGPDELTRFRARSAGCDHCHTIRRRHDTYLVRQAGGDFPIHQVGSTCINDYLGADVLASLEFVSTRMSCDDLEEWGGCGSGTWYWSIDQVLALAATAIRTVGWVSAGEARDSTFKRSTADVVTSVLTAWSPREKQALAEDYPQVWAALKGDSRQIDLDTAEATKAWARGLTSDGASDYIHNLRVACAADEISTREMGLVVSAVAAWHREQEREMAKRRSAAAGSGWIGKAGDKVGKKLSAADKRAGAAAIPEQEGDVTVVRTFETDFGVKTLVKVVTDAGATISWFATGDLEVSIGQRVKISGTIKKLDEYRGAKETVLTRATIEVIQQTRAA